MTDLSRPSPVWRKSSRSGCGNNNCVEIASLVDAVLVRDSKDPDGPVMSFAQPDWQAFLSAVKHGGRYSG